jgi:tetratricopeptide (TPR) repeat protein
MKLANAFAAAAISTLVLAATPAQAQLEMTTIRGVVREADGQPIPDVQVSMEFKGESRTKVVKTATTDKKGAYIKAGLRNGDWTISFTKAGYRNRAVQTYISGGLVTEIPPVTMLKGETAAGGEAAPASGQGAAAAPASPAPSAGSERARQVSQTYNKAMEAIKAGRNDEAETLLKAALVEMPTLAEAHSNLGYLYVQRNDNAAAEAAFRKVVELRPEASAGYVSLATLLGTTKREQEALALLKEAAPRFEQDARFQFALGATAFNQNLLEPAEAAFLKVTQLDPANAEAYFFLGSTALNRGDTAVALERLEKYVALAPPDGPNLAAAQALLATLKKK